jgi:hypothetical protein
MNRGKYRTADSRQIHLKRFRSGRYTNEGKGRLGQTFSCRETKQGAKGKKEAGLFVMTCAESSQDAA